MKKKIIIRVCSIAMGAVLLAGGVFTASAQAATTTTSSRVASRAALQAQRLQNIVSRADQEIARRITALNALSARINAMQKVSANDKSSLSSTIQSQISDMNSLQAKIMADENSTSSLKADIKSITGSYRIFALVIPQGAIEAAADRVMTIVSDMTTIGAKLQTRVTALGGSASATITSALADFNAKVADANTQAQAAVSEVAGLTPDQGVQAQMQANTSALKDARSKIQAAQKDLVAARNDAETMVKAFIQMSAASSSAATSSQ
jgi:chromosome segregation ATPase